MKNGLIVLFLFIGLVLAWWFDYRGFWHGVMVGLQVWWLWSIRPWKDRVRVKEIVIDGKVI